MEGAAHRIRSNFGGHLRGLRDLVVREGELVDTAIGLATRALLERDPAVAEEVVTGDKAINNLHLDVRRLAFELILREGPVAGDLREVIASLHISIELERIADHAVSIAKEARWLASLPPLAPAVDIETMAVYGGMQFRDALGAIVARDVERARAVAVRDDRLDRVYHRIRDELIERMSDDPGNVLAAVGLLSVAHHLERIGDRVTNLAEDLIFLDSGDMVELG